MLGLTPPPGEASPPRLVVSNHRSRVRVRALTGFLPRILGALAVTFGLFGWARARAGGNAGYGTWRCRQRGRSAWGCSVGPVCGCAELPEHRVAATYLRRRDGDRFRLDRRDGGLPRGEEPAPASDVFALGVTLFAAVEGVPPFGAADIPLAVMGDPRTADPCALTDMAALSRARSRQLLAAVSNNVAEPEEPEQPLVQPAETGSGSSSFAQCAHRLCVYWIYDRSPARIGRGARRGCSLLRLPTRGWGVAISCLRPVDRRGVEWLEKGLPSSSSVTRLAESVRRARCFPLASATALEVMLL